MQRSQQLIVFDSTNVTNAQRVEINMGGNPGKEITVELTEIMLTK